MSRHDRYQMLAASAVDFALAPAEAEELRAHTSTCAECRRFEAGLANDAGLARLLPSPHAPDQVRESVVAAALTSRTVVAPRLSFGSMSLIAIAIAALAGLALINRTFSGPGQVPIRSWARFAETTPFANGSVNDIVAGGPGLVAVGNVTNSLASPGPDPSAPAGRPGSGVTAGCGCGDGAVWTSPDGDHWTRAPSNPSFEGAPLVRVARRGGQLVVSSVGRFWNSNDGLTWQSSTGLGTYAESCVYYGGIAIGGPGFVAVGADKCGLSSTPDAVVVSADGRVWTVAPSSSALGGVGGAAVASKGSRLVAVGADPGQPALWTSSDGQTWTSVGSAELPPLPSASLIDITAGDSGYVAVGSDGSSAAAWVSRDGLTWRRAPASLAFDDAQMMRVVWTGSQFIAIGRSLVGDGVAWTSADGLTWTRLDTGGIFVGSAPLLAAAQLGSELVLIGSDSQGRLVGAVGPAR
jgi:hypothetical protein